MGEGGILSRARRLSGRISAVAARRWKRGLLPCRLLPFSSPPHSCLLQLSRPTQRFFKCCSLYWTLPLDDQGRDKHVDLALPSSSILLLIHSGGDWDKAKQSRWKSRGAPQSEEPDSGGVGLVWLRKGYFERVPEHLRAMSVMPKRATWPPWAPTLLVELHKCSSDVGKPKGGTLFSDKGLNLSM